MEFDQQFVEFIVKALVNKPDEVKTERKIDDQGILITVTTATEDTGYVIGKAGKTAIAIRTLLATLGAKSNSRISFRIDAPDNGKRRAPVTDSADQQPAPAMDQGAVESLTF